MEGGLGNDHESESNPGPHGPLDPYKVGMLLLASQLLLCLRG